MKHLPSRPEVPSGRPSREDGERYDLRQPNGDAQSVHTKVSGEKYFYEPFGELKELYFNYLIC